LTSIAQLCDDRLEESNKELTKLSKECADQENCIAVLTSETESLKNELSYKQSSHNDSGAGKVSEAQYEDLIAALSLENSHLKVDIEQIRKEMDILRSRTSNPSQTPSLTNRRGASSASAPSTTGRGGGASRGGNSSRLHAPSGWVSWRSQYETGPSDYIV